MLIGPTVCEDIWQPGPPATDLSLAGAQLIANISASPFHVGKEREREQMLATRARDNVVAFVNAVGGQDELIFDGHSVVLDDEGQVVARAPGFEEALLIVDVDPIEAVGRRAARCSPADPRERAGAGARDSRRSHRRSAGDQGATSRADDRAHARRPRADEAGARARAQGLRREERLRGDRRRCLRRDRPALTAASPRRRSGRNACTASRCPRGTARPRRGPTRGSSPRTSALRSWSCRSSRWWRASTPCW